MKNKFIVSLTIKQLLFLGIHVGHLKKNSYFLSGWILNGWRNNIFIINLLKSFLLIKIGLKMIKNTIKVSRPFWFASLNKVYGSLISRYALLSGESFNIYHWVGGNLTNSKLILGWLSILIFLMKKKKYILRYMDKKVLNSLSGFLNKQIRRRKNSYYINKVKGRHRLRFKRSIYYRNLKKSFKTKRWWLRFNETLLSYILERGDRGSPSKKKFHKVIKKVRRRFFKRLLRRKNCLTFKKSRFFFFKRRQNRKIYRKVMSFMKLFRFNIQKKYYIYNNSKNLFKLNFYKAFGYSYYYKYNNNLLLKKKLLLKFLKYYKKNYKFFYKLKLNFEKSFYNKNKDKFERIFELNLLRRGLQKKLNNLFINKKMRFIIKKDINNYTNMIKIINNLIFNKKPILSKKLIKIKRNIKNLKFFFNSLKKWRNVKNKLLHSKLIKKKLKSKFSYYFLRKGKRRIYLLKKKKRKNLNFVRILKKYRWISLLDPETKTRRPGGGFVPTFLDNQIIVNEFAKSNIPFITLVDSNIISTSIFIPFPSNDDSSLCVNFFCYLISKSIFIGKFFLLKKWKNKIKLNNRENIIKKKYLFNLYIQENWNINERNIFLDYQDSKFEIKRLVSDLIDLNFESYDIGNEIKNNLLIDYKAFFSYEFDTSSYLKLFNI